MSARTRIATAALVTGLIAAAAAPSMAGDASSPIPYTPQVTDPTGDSGPGGSSADIVSAGFTTTGVAKVVSKTTYTTKVVTKTVVRKVKGRTTKVKVKKKVRVAHTTKVVQYVPDTLVAKVTMADVPSSSPGSYTSFAFDVPGCGTAYLNYTPGAVGSDPSQSGFADFSACGKSSPTDSGSFFFKPSIEGNTIVMAVPLAKLPPRVATGTKLFNFDVSTGVSDPVLGLGLFSAYDDAQGSPMATYTIG